MKLELINADSCKPPVVLTEFPVIVGLDPASDVCFDDSSLGHYQCMIDHSDGTLMVWDLGTKLGTSVNGVRVDKKAPLNSGDKLTVGRNRFLVQFDDGHGKPPRRSEQPQPDGRTKRRSAAGHRRQPALPT
jgi:predicted component of type VI protein secretion system